MSKLRHCVGGSAAGSTAVAILPAATLAGHWPQWQHGRAAAHQRRGSAALQQAALHTCSPLYSSTTFSCHLVILAAGQVCVVCRPPAGTAMAAVSSGNTWLPDTSTGHTEAAGQPCLHTSLTTPHQDRTEDELLNSGNMKLRKNDLWNISLLPMTSMILLTKVVRLVVDSRSDSSYAIIILL